MYRILVLNFGGTSSKVSVYEDDRCVREHTFDYTPEELHLSSSGKEQLAIKKKCLLSWLDSIEVSVADIDAYAVRLGGMFYGGNGGTFLVDGAVRKQVDLSYHPDKPLSHATRVTMALVDELQREQAVKKPSYATDPASINQYLPESRITGCPLFTKGASFHALSQRAAARKAAADLGKKYEEANIIVVHAGGGVSVGAHEKGRVIDVNDSTGVGDGPFSTNRAGTVPVGQLMKLCFSGKYTEKEVYRTLQSESGLKGYLGTEDLREVERRIQEGDVQAELVFNALVYQISREIGACYATLCCQVDAIAMTAGMAYSDRLAERIKARVGNMAPVLRYPGGLENEALALGAYRILTGEEAPAVYNGECGHVQPFFST